jgi:hypothetical protein
VKIIPVVGIKEKTVTNYNDSRLPKQNKHREELLLALNATQWETFHGDDRSDNHKREHVITLEPEGLAYLTLLDSEIASYDNIPSDIKIILIRYLSFYFDRLLAWQSSQRGRKTGIFGNLSLGYIMHTQDSKGVISVEFYYDTNSDKTQEVIYIFKILAYGQGFADERINEIAGEK